MSTVVVVGTQWGDEERKITDFLAESADVVARYQGGNNAGHTILINNKKYKLSLIPSGIFYTDKICVIGNGMVVNPKALIEEIDIFTIMASRPTISASAIARMSLCHIIWCWTGWRKNAKDRTKSGRPAKDRPCLYGQSRAQRHSHRRLARQGRI